MTPRPPAAHRDPAHTPGHWVLARAGKKVLRPGGKETTHWLLENAPIRGADIVELAPGLGLTAQDILARKPRSYTGIDRDEDACNTTRAALKGRGKILQGQADATGLPDNSCDIVVAEAMLSMHTDTTKDAIFTEIARILRPGGIMLSHELLLTPDDIDPDTATTIRRDIARAIHVNARPLTTSEWSARAAAAGLVTTATTTTSMSLLETRRLLADEGWRTLTILRNIATNTALRSQVLSMRAAFRTHRDNLGAIGRVYTLAH